MRQIVNISLSEPMNKVVKDVVKSGQYTTTSEFFRDLLRRWIDEQSYNDVVASEKDFASGKSKRLRSLTDLRS
jgi:Arc/MetJ-type ribon-helix-helix transcriptional regulator